MQRSSSATNEWEQVATAGPSNWNSRSAAKRYFDLLAPEHNVRPRGQPECRPAWINFTYPTFMCHVAHIALFSSSPDRVPCFRTTSALASSPPHVIVGKDAITTPKFT
jgi:hypothetical protein